MNKLRIYLVRHGQSESNTDWDVNINKADHAIELTDEGKRQAVGAGAFLLEDLALRVPNSSKMGPYNVRVWNSPYLRTRQTSQIIFDQIRLLNEQDDPCFSIDQKEHFLLHEQQFGIFDGLSDYDRARDYPVEWAHYQKCKKFGGKSWVKHPGGESRMDVAMRVHQAFGTFHRDHERHDIDTIIVVGHGTTNRAFAMAWLHKPPEWFENEPNPKNCSVRLIENGQDKGYIFAGYKNPPGYKHKK